MRTMSLMDATQLANNVAGCLAAVGALASAYFAWVALEANKKNTTDTSKGVGWLER
jgi:hypothetical protein